MYEKLDVDIIGKDTFLELPIYKRKKKLKLIYVNPNLYERLIEPYSFAKAKNYLEEYFSITINDEYRLNDDVVGFGYADYQGDPSGIALDGNKGSGRAYYVSDRFNLKGELTPLATSPYPIYNNGKLSLESAIHETLISNVLAEEFNTYETLAILDPEEPYLFPGSEEEMRTAVMIRTYKDNELYRLSHRFINKLPFAREELERIASEMGVLEGKKFIHRLLHGAWSLGNLSIGTNMIDFDTTYFLKNRNPSFSFTYKYPTNYFGEEHLGQIKILELILNSELNVDNVDIKHLSEIIVENRYQTIINEFPNLMGINAAVPNSLVDKFIELSKYGYKCYDELYTMCPKNDDVAVFNFSRFFRHYPTLIRDECYSVSKCLELLINSEGEIFDTENEHLRIVVDNAFSDYQVDTDELLTELIEQAIQFIKDYDEVFKRNVRDIEVASLNAYIVNEDRTHLFNNRLTKYHLAELEDKEIVNRLMNLIIEASDRKLDREEHICDLHIGNGFYSYRLINRKKNTIRELKFDFDGRLLNKRDEKNKVLLKRERG